MSQRTYHSARLAKIGEGICCAPHCRAASVDGSPVPLCGVHIRKTYEFGLSVVSDGWMEASRELAAVERERLTTITPSEQPGLDTPGLVYFIRRAALIKIGWTSHLKQRMRRLRPDEILLLESGTMRDERARHEQFTTYRVHGEWFRDVEPIRDYIQGHLIDVITTP